VKEGIGDLVAFMQRDDLPVLAQATISHAQLETIHPFTDGNGRTGRALLHALLRNKGLTVNVTVPISAGLLTDIQSYFTALDAYRAGDTATLVSLVADASFSAVGNGRLLVKDLRELRAQWRQRIKARSDSRLWDVVDVVLCHPVVNAQLLADELGVGITNTYRYLEPLESAGVLVEFTGNRRHRIWRSDEALNALDAFAVRAGRRSSSWQSL
jgi:Fic family protein